MECGAVHDRSRRRVPDAESGRHLEPDHRADRGVGVQSVLRRCGRRGSLALRTGGGPEVQPAGVRRRQFSWRDLEVPVTLVSDEGVVQERFPRHERLGRAYGYWTPLDTLALSVVYLYEQFHRTVASSGTENILDLHTHRIPLGVQYFSASGWSANAMATHISQRGTFADLVFSPTGEDSFWVVDTAIGYRLPKRFGRLAFEVKNLFDREFRFQDTDPGNPTVKPRRLALLTLSLGI